MRYCDLKYYFADRLVELYDWDSIDSYRVRSHNAFTLIQELLEDRIPNNIKIGNDVMMGPDIYIPANNHNFDRIDIPMRIQGTSNSKPVIIEDDCWIGARVIITPGKRICKGAIVGAGSVVTRSVENYSVVGGNPARIIRNRKNNGESTNC